MLTQFSASNTAALSWTLYVSILLEAGSVLFVYEDVRQEVKPFASGSADNDDMFGEALGVVQKGGTFVRSGLQM
jgi:hypothetical protein